MVLWSVVGLFVQCCAALQPLMQQSTLIVVVAVTAAWPAILQGQCGQLWSGLCGPFRLVLGVGGVLCLAMGCAGHVVN
jgi:hypothetical protein